MDIYEKIVAYCDKNKISITEFEKRCKLGNGTVGRWSRGGSPNLTTLQQIATETNVPLKKWIL